MLFVSPKMKNAIAVLNSLDNTAFPTWSRKFPHGDVGDPGSGILANTGVGGREFSA